MSFTILGTGSALPEKKIDNESLTAFLETSDEWIGTRTGIRERRVLAGETLLSLAKKAALSALAEAKLSAADIDFVVCSTLQSDYISPSLSILLAGELGIKAKRNLDINMGCTGFLYALDAADAFLASVRAERALVVCAESMSRLADWKDRSTCVLFGDGAGAVVVGKGTGLLSMNFKTEPDSEGLLTVLGQEGNCPFRNPEVSENSESSAEQPRKPYGVLRMNGQEIYKFAVSSIVRDIGELLEAQGLTSEDISCFVLHQANLRIIESARKKLGQPEEKVPHNLERTGNVSSASIPILLDELNKCGRFRRGDKLVLSAFGAGLASAAALVEWQIG